MTVFQEDLKRVTDEQGDRMVQEIRQNKGYADITDGGLKALATLRLAQAVEDVARELGTATSIQYALMSVTDEQGDRMVREIRQNKGYADITDGGLEALATLRLAQAFEDVAEGLGIQNMMIPPY